MITERDIETATLVLAECAAHDLWFPQGGEAVILAWARTFAESGLSREDLIAGVDRAYDRAEGDFRPLPACIVQNARAAYFEALKALPDDRRELMEEANYALQEMGFTPPQAHRYARRVALGREPEVQLTEDQLAELRRRLAERKALGEAS